ncbi:MAG: hypothetical protein ABR572_02670 [Cryomorphaceae bacterium]|nr:hypothetical protein [Flavobacteriales bacterium]
MRKLICVSVFAVLSVFTAFGQEADMGNPTVFSKSLFKNVTPSYGVIDVNYVHTELFGESLPGFGANFGVVFGKHWLTGLTVSGSTTSALSLGEPSVEVVNPRYNYFFAGWNNALILFPSSVVNVSVPLSVGVAGVHFNDRYQQGSVNYSGRLDQEYFFAAEAGVNLHVNLFEHMSLTAGASWRLVDGVSRAGANSDFSAPFFNVGLRFKLF